MDTELDTDLDAASKAVSSTERINESVSESDISISLAPMVRGRGSSSRTVCMVKVEAPVASTGERCLFDDGCRPHRQSRSAAHEFPTTRE